MPRPPWYWLTYYTTKSNILELGVLLCTWKHDLYLSSLLS